MHNFNFEPTCFIDLSLPYLSIDPAFWADERADRPLSDKIVTEIGFENRLSS